MPYPSGQLAPEDMTARKQNQNRQTKTKTVLETRKRDHRARVLEII